MNINFAQPLWLWGLLLIPAGWLWSLVWRKVTKTHTYSLQKFIDPNLLEHVLINKGSIARRNYTGLLYSLLVFCIIIALANPRWRYTDIDTFQPSASMVILLDLSSSMNATDVTPSRIIRARQNIEDLLNLSKGLKMGIIGFAGYPHLISPITDDIYTLKNYIPALDTDLTNIQGNSLSNAFKLGAELLSHEPGEKKSILLVSDGNFAANDFSRELQVLAAQNIQVHVIGVGTAAGAPYKTNNGGLHKVNGKVVTAKLNVEVLKNIAKLGHGVYTESGLGDLGLRTILLKAQQNDIEQIAAGKIRQWDDQYYMFIIPAALILLYLMRQRILYMIIIGFFTFAMSNSEVYAFEFKTLWQNSGQRGQGFYTNGDFKQAAETFTDPYHKGVALYRDGQYSAAEEQFKQAQRASVKTAAIYNAGNAQMQQQKWRAAIKSYEEVLDIEPEHVAAKHNLEIARKMLAQNKEEDKSDCECNNKDKNGEGDNNKNSDQKNKSDPQNNADKKENDGNEEQQSDQEKQKQSSQTEQNDNAEAKEAESQKSQAEESEGDEANNSKAKAMQNLSLSEDDARVEQWLNRVDSDIKVFLRNKFYVEDMLGAQ